MTSSGISRRQVLGLFGVGAVAGAGAGVAGTSIGKNESRSHPASVPFFGEHQAGIATPAQDRLHFAAFDLGPGATRADLISLLQSWTGAAAQMTAGRHRRGAGTGRGPADPDRRLRHQPVRPPLRFDRPATRPAGRPARVSG